MHKETLRGVDSGQLDSSMDSFANRDCMAVPSQLLPICDAIFGMVNAGELSEGRRYTLPISGRGHGMTLTLSIAGAETVQKEESHFYSGGLSPRQLRRLMDYIESNISEAIPLTSLAAVAGLSTSYFLRAFKAAVGVTPHAHILRRRIEMAKAMMVETDAPLAHIAPACGLADQSHLCRQFRRIVGVTPSRWRRAGR